MKKAKWVLVAEIQNYEKGDNRGNWPQKPWNMHKNSTKFVFISNKAVKKEIDPKN